MDAEIQLVRRRESASGSDTPECVSMSGRPSHSTLVAVPWSWQELLKIKGFSEYFMSTWSLDELEECRRLLYPDMKANDVEERYDRWGGLPRYVLEKINDSEQKRLSSAIARSSVQLVREAVVGCSLLPSVSDLLLHTVVDDNFEDTRTEWASPWVCERFLEKALATEKESLISFVRVARGPELGVLRGLLWEGLCHGRLAQGGTFR